MHRHSGSGRNADRRWRGADLLAGQVGAQELAEIAEEESLRSLTLDLYEERKKRAAGRRSQMVWQVVVGAWLVGLSVVVAWMLVA